MIKINWTINETRAFLQIHKLKLLWKLYIFLNMEVFNN